MGPRGLERLSLGQFGRLAQNAPSPGQALWLFEAMPTRLAAERGLDSRSRRRARAWIEIRRAKALSLHRGPAAAFSTARRAVTLARGLGALGVEAQIVLATLLGARGRFQQAQDLAAQAARRSTAANPALRTWAHMVRGENLLRSGDPSGAARVLRRARRWALQTKDPLYLAHIERDLAACRQAVRG